MVGGRRHKRIPPDRKEACEGLSGKLFLCLLSKGIEKITSDKATGVTSGDWELFVFKCK